MVAAVSEALELPVGTAVETARVAMQRGRSVVNGDVVLGRFEDSDDVVVGNVWFHCKVRGVTLTCISSWPLLESGARSLRVRMADEPTLVRTDTLEESCIFSATNSGTAIVLRVAAH